MRLSPKGGSKVRSTSTASVSNVTSTAATHCGVCACTVPAVAVPEIKPVSPLTSPLRRVDVGELDRWSGFPAERDAVLSIAKQANNAVFYGGDTHNDWAAVAIDAGGDVVAAEFDTAAVTAPGNEEQAFMLPPDFIAAIQTAGTCPTHRVVAAARAVLAC